MHWKVTYRPVASNISWLVWLLSKSMAMLACLKLVSGICLMLSLSVVEADDAEQR